MGKEIFSKNVKFFLRMKALKFVLLIALLGGLLAQLTGPILGGGPKDSRDSEGDDVIQLDPREWDGTFNNQDLEDPMVARGEDEEEKERPMNGPGGRGQGRGQRGQGRRSPHEEQFPPIADKNESGWM